MGLLHITSKSSWAHMAQILPSEYEWVRILFDNGDLGSKLQHHGTCKPFWKKSKTSHSCEISHIKNDIM
jgi:hypothetical protein